MSFSHTKIFLITLESSYSLFLNSELFHLDISHTPQTQCVHGQPDIVFLFHSFFLNPLTNK